MATSLALVGCQTDDILDSRPGSEQSANTAIRFDGEAGNISRATSNTGNTDVKLDYQFKMYGVKKVNNGENASYQDVFKDYSLWSETANNTTSNTKGWEYVGSANSTHGSGNVKIGDTSQTIKYWDYSSEDYRFVAGSPIANFTFNKAIEGDGSIATATVTGLAGHLNANAEGTAITTNPVYIAEPKVVAKSEYKKEVQFSFVRQQSKVRVGIYETIPGYKIKDIKFYKQGESGLEVSNDHNIILTSTTGDYFKGGTEVTGTITYNWTPTPSYTFAYTSGLTSAKNWYGGNLADGVKATTSTEATVANLYGTDADMESNGYFTVIPTPSATDASAILIKCDYTLISEDNSGETINVTGATAAIPAAFCKWEPNVMYTYIFKISQNTNGYTGDDPQHTGLFPITFDAAVADFTEKKQGTITTIATPSITTYQAGSVEDGGVKYKANKEIYAVVAENESGSVNTLNDADVQVYKLTKQRNEADLQISGIIATELIDGHKVNKEVPSTNATVDTVTLTANKYLKFTPDAEGWYAIQYKIADNAYTYKVINVVAGSGGGSIIPNN